jgi:hypothetical protein
MALITEGRSDVEQDGATAPLLPRHVWRAVVAVIGTLLAFAAYLMTMRGEAILFDLPAAAARMFCL